MFDHALMNGRTKGYVQKKIRKKRNVWSVRRARWRRWRRFGVDWHYVETQWKIVDIKRARRSQVSSKQNCKMNDAHDRPIKNLKVSNLRIYKQPGLCVQPRLPKANGEAKLFIQKRARKSRVELKASFKSKASSVSSSYVLRTSPDVVTHFFFPFTGSGKVASRKKLARKRSSLSDEDIFCLKVRDSL